MTGVKANSTQWEAFGIGFGALWGFLVIPGDFTFIIARPVTRPDNVTDKGFSCLGPLVAEFLMPDQRRPLMLLFRI